MADTGRHSSSWASGFCVLACIDASRAVFSRLFVLFFILHHCVEGLRGAEV